MTTKKTKSKPIEPNCPIYKRCNKMLYLNIGLVIGVFVGIGVTLGMLAKEREERKKYNREKP